jgi:hypothetical protein
MWKGIIADYKGENPVGIVKSSGYLIYITAYREKNGTDLVIEID